VTLKRRYKKVKNSSAYCKIFKCVKSTSQSISEFMGKAVPPPKHLGTKNEVKLNGTYCRASWVPKGMGECLRINYGKQIS
jgi:hypothetical protein